MLPSKNTRLVVNLVALSSGMFMLAYASVPLYDLFCRMTGYGGTTQTATHAPGKVLDQEIALEFNADMAPGLPWQFKPGEHRINVKIGEQGLTYYTAKNESNMPVTGRAVYNVLPFKAGPYFVKVDCFCFTEQTLPAGADVNMPVSFYIDPAIANDPEMKDVKTITLSYTFFPVKTEAKK